MTKLVTIGDSLTQGFCSGSISKTRSSFPAMVARALGLSDAEFCVPEFNGEGGLPLNIEQLLREFDSAWRPGRGLHKLAAIDIARRMMDRVEDYWERGAGSAASASGALHHNLAVFGFEVDHAYRVDEGLCSDIVAEPKTRDNVFAVPDHSIARAARRTLNPSLTEPHRRLTQLTSVQAISETEGAIENLFVWLGANNALKTAIVLKVHPSTPKSADDPNLFDRGVTLWTEADFHAAFTRLAQGVDQLDPKPHRVFVGTVPRVTVLPLLNGVSFRTPELDADKHFENYVHFWVRESAFRRHPKGFASLSREKAAEIDGTIARYNDGIRAIAQARGWHVVDYHGILESLAFRSNSGRPTYVFPHGLVAALRENPATRYLVRDDGTAMLDTRFIRANQHGQIIQGGLFSLDGVHPSTIGYGIIAHELLVAIGNATKQPNLHSRLDWNRIVAADTLVTSPPRCLPDVEALLEIVGSYGLLDVVLRAFTQDKRSASVAAAATASGDSGAAVSRVTPLADSSIAAVSSSGESSGFESISTPQVTGGAVETMSDDSVRQYVILPARGMRARGSEATTTSAYLRSLVPADIALESAAPASYSLPAGVRVIDSIHEDGAKLVEMTEATARDLAAAQPGVRVEAVRYYKIARPERFAIVAAPTPATATAALARTSPVKVIDSTTGIGIEGVDIVAFTDFANRLGASARTNANGDALLDFGVAQPRIERLYVYPPLAGYWGAFRSRVTPADISTIPLVPVLGVERTALDAFVGRGRDTDGADVKVAVIDTGVGPHPLLDAIATGDADNGDGHGTHVAGIIRATGGAAVQIRSYRVFSRPGGLSANFSIAKAIDEAVRDGCDVLNLSLKIAPQLDKAGLTVDPVVAAALEDARDAGALPIAAAGNDHRSIVAFPARERTCIAVTALGKVGTYPAGALEEADVLLPPSGASGDDFIAAFSNFGPEVTVAAPGVGIVSTVPGGFGVMSGTSMACPAVAGVTARLLSRSNAVRQMPRDSARANAIQQLLLRSTQSLGFPRDYEGFGVPR